MDETSKMRFTFRQLEYFVAVVGEGTISGAAEKLHVSSPSISAALTQLEKDFKVQLFDRHHAKGLSLTRKGELFFLEAQKILYRARRLNEVGHSLAENKVEPISLGSLSSIAPIVVPKLCQDFLKDYPDTDFNFVNTSHSKLINGLQLAEIALALTYDYKIPKSVSFIPLVALQPHVLIGKNSQLAKRKRLSLDDLQEERFLQVLTPPIRDHALSIFQQAGVKPNIIEKLPDISVSTMVSHGYGFTFVYLIPSAEQNLDGSQSVVIPLDELYDPLVLGIAALNEGGESPTIQAFVDYCRKSISEHSIPGVRKQGEP